MALFFKKIKNRGIMMGFKKQMNIVGSIIAMLVISISGIGIYALKGILANIRIQVAKVKTEIQICIAFLLKIKKFKKFVEKKY
ncbi:hypothetical protein QIA41_05130 (plasmid) [Borreliella sinica]|uniref:hypothetical protein n=1 Tax=Borreliella sinica TaxID=87162 RepID=UPI003AF075F2